MAPCAEELIQVNSTLVATTPDVDAYYYFHYLIFTLTAIWVVARVINLYSFRSCFVGIPTNVEPEQLIVSWQLANGSSDSGTNLISSGMHQPTTSFFESMMSNASTSQYCDTTMSHSATSLCHETDMSHQMSSLYADNQSNAGGNCASEYSLFTDLLNGSNDGAMVPRMAQPSANGLIQCVVQPNVMYHNGPSGMPFVTQNGHHTASNGVQFISQNGMQNNLVTTPQMPYVQGVQQSGMMAAANVPFMQQNGQIVYLSQVPQTTAPATPSMTAAVEINNTTSLAGSTAAVLVQGDNAVSNSTDQIHIGDASANAAEIADEMAEQTGRLWTRQMNWWHSIFLR